MTLGKPIALQVPRLTREEVYALQALERGEANAYQQRLAVKVMLDKFARSYDVAFIPGAPDQSAFLAGRGYVGQQLIKYMRITPTKLRELEKNNEA